MRHRAAPVVLSASLLLIGAACSDDKNDAVTSSSVGSEAPVGNGADTSAVAPGSSAQTGTGPTLAEVVQATLAQGSARYTVQTGASVDDLLDSMTGSGSGGSTSSSGSVGGSDSSTSSSTATSDSTATAGSAATGDTTGGSGAPGTEGCDVTPSPEMVKGELDAQQHLRCVALPDGQLVIVQDRDIFVQADGAWSVVHVQFDNALAQLEPDALAALIDPDAVMAALAGDAMPGGSNSSTSSLPAGGETTSGGSTGQSSNTNAGAQDTSGGSTGSSSSESGSSSGGSSSGSLQGTEGPNGFEYRVMVSIDDLDDPFLVALAMRAGAQTVEVRVLADPSSNVVTAMAFDFPDAADTSGDASGNGTSGTSPTGSGAGQGGGTTVNPQGGGSGSTVAATVSTLPQTEDSLGADSTLPDSAFDVSAVGMAFTSLGDTVTIGVPAEPADLTLGDLAAALSVDLPSIGG